MRSGYCAGCKRPALLIEEYCAACDARENGEE